MLIIDCNEAQQVASDESVSHQLYGLVKAKLSESDLDVLLIIVGCQRTTHHLDQRFILFRQHGARLKK